MLKIALLSTTITIIPFCASACPEGQHEQCIPWTDACACFGNLGPDEPLGPLRPVVPDEIDPIFEAANDFAVQYATYLPDASRQIIDEAVNNVDKGISDAAKSLVKAGYDIADAGKAILRYAEREITGIPDVLSNAEKRLREGKVVDAMWHLATEPVQRRSDNAAQLVQENELVASAAQAAAGFYGGPAGSAAFAAWKSYHDSGGRIDLALKAGAMAYATQAGYANTSALPTGSVGEVARKAATTGAVAGLAVAASGGTDEDALEVFLKSSGAVVVQSGQAYVKQYAAENVNVQALTVETDSYCSSIFGGTCSEVQEWAETARANAENVEQIAQSKPAVVFTPDGNWAITWVPSSNSSSGSSSAPSIALTYVGSGSPYFEKMEEVATLTGQTLHAPHSPAEANDTGWIYIGRRHNDGTWLGSRSSDLSERSLEELEGLTISLDMDVNLHTGPRRGCNLGDDQPITGKIEAGRQIRIISAIRLRSGCSNYIWAEVGEM